MHFIEKEPGQKREDFVNKLKSSKILRVPGAYNPLTAKLIEEIGYDANLCFGQGNGKRSWFSRYRFNNITRCKSLDLI